MDNVQKTLNNYLEEVKNLEKDIKEGDKEVD